MENRFLKVKNFTKNLYIQKGFACHAFDNVILLILLFVRWSLTLGLMQG